MLSVGKLAHLAQMQEGGDADEAVLDGTSDQLLFILMCFTKCRPAFHDSLDFISVQERMAQEFREAASSLRGKQKQSLDAQVDAVIRAKGTRLRAERRHGLLGVRGFLSFS
jgi:nuclear pore complex protein Nup133